MLSECFAEKRARGRHCRGFTPTAFRIRLVRFEMIMDTAASDVSKRTGATCSYTPLLLLQVKERQSPISW